MTDVGEDLHDYFLDLADLLVKSGRASMPARRPLCFVIQVPSETLDFLYNTSDESFSLQLIERLAKKENSKDFARLCNHINKSKCLDQVDLSRLSEIQAQIFRLLQIEGLNKNQIDSNIRFGLSDSHFFIEKIDNPCIQIMEAQLRIDGEYWSMFDSNNPELDSSYVAEYFSRQISEACQVQLCLKDNVCGSAKSINYASNSLNKLLEQGKHVIQITSVAPEFELNSEISREMSQVIEWATEARRILNNSKFDISLGKKISEEHSGRLSFLFSRLNVSLNSLCSLFKDIAAKARQASAAQ
jgi:hypothetical protein